MKASVKLETNEFSLLRVEKQETTNYAVGQIVHLIGEISYSMHVMRDPAYRGNTRNNYKDDCPVTYAGNLKVEHEVHFKQYLQQSTGLDLVDGLVEMNFSREKLSGGHAKVWLNDVIRFSLVAPVKDAEALNRLAITAIGRRKSYGLGNVLVVSAISLAAND